MNSSHDTTKFRILVQVEERKPCHWQGFGGRIGEDNSKYIQIMRGNVVLPELYYLSINTICPYKYKKICNISFSTEHTNQCFMRNFSHFLWKLNASLTNRARFVEFSLGVLTDWIDGDSPKNVTNYLSSLIQQRIFDSFIERDPFISILGKVKCFMIV